MVDEFTDTYGDTANVYTHSGRVYLTTVTDPGTRHEANAELSFTPDEALKYAKAVKRAAKAGRAHLDRRQRLLGR